MRAVRTGLFLAALALAANASAADLRIVDSHGTQLVLSNAVIEYGGFLANELEKDGVRVMQGDGAVTVKWSDIDTVKVIKADESAKPPRLDLEITLRNGRKIPATLATDKAAKLRGKSDLGDYAIDLLKVRSMTPVR